MTVLSNIGLLTAASKQQEKEKQRGNNNRNERNNRNNNDSGNNSANNSSINLESLASPGSRSVSPAPSQASLSSLPPAQQSQQTHTPQPTPRAQISRQVSQVSQISQGSQESQSSQSSSAPRQELHNIREFYRFLKQMNKGIRIADESLTKLFGIGDDNENSNENESKKKSEMNERNMFVNFCCVCMISIINEMFMFCYARLCKARVTIGGGIDQQTQSKLLRNGANVIIATPGESNILALNQCNYVVLDEADRMIDLGFEPQVNEIFEKMPATNMRLMDDEECERSRMYTQTFMFTATMPIEIERMTRKYLRNPVYIAIGDTAAERVGQHILWINAKSNNSGGNDCENNNYTDMDKIFTNMKKI